MVTGVLPRVASWAAVRVVPPTVTLLRPSGAVTVIVPLVLSEVFATVIRPISLTVAWPVAAPLPSTGVMLGTPSVRPLMVMVSVAVVVLPSPSVRV
ncbi:hypothetical protein SDC9_188649 [bioreactor metagenome]|uniref:Uncharacterized protein n=1 Tax=bioreactor metagenome TaxID=1076179 RepID=A0A645HPY2_9ZZZZ